MIYIFTAIYCEAQKLIEFFHLTKEQESGVPFQVFSNEEAQICLTVTGVGSVAAAVAVSSVCTWKRAGQNDFLVNIGVCGADGGPERVGQIYQVLKITEQATGRTFYPDILYRHPFGEAVLHTGARLYDQKTAAREKAAIRTAADKRAGAKEPAANQSAEPKDVSMQLYDMEAAGIYQAGAYFFGPHRMIFIKIISDVGQPDKLTAGQVTALIETRAEALCAYIRRLSEAGQAEAQQEADWDEQQEMEIRQLCADLHCSQVMQAAVRQSVKYAWLSGVNYRAVLDELYGSGRLPCRDKREGKQCLEELKRRLL